MLSRLLRRPVSLALFLGALVSVGVFVMLATGLGPDRRIKLALGLSVIGTPCTPSPESVRNPPGATGSWRTGTPLPREQDEIRAATGDGNVYLGTGILLEHDNTGYKSVARMYALDGGRYTELPDAPIRVDHPLLVAGGGFVYLVGGFSDSVPTRRAWRYSVRERRWSELAPMPTARGALGGAVIGDRLYAVGGTPATSGDAIVPYSTMEILDLRTGRWTAGPPMRFARHHAGVTELEGSLYVVGGRGRSDFSLEHTERFDPRAGRWETLPELPQGSGGLAAVAAVGELIAIGGGDDPQEWVTGATWAFDPDRNRWRRLPDLLQARHGHGAAALAGRVYVFGGAPCPGVGRTAAVELLDIR